MNLALIMFSIATAQFPAIILRYLPFSKSLTPEKKKKLFAAYGLCFILQLILIYFIVKNQYHTLTPLTYKRLLFMLSTSYVFLNTLFIKKMVYKHLFFYGMQGGYSLLVHSLVAPFVGILSPYMSVPYQFALQTGLYLLLMALITIPLWKKIGNSIIFKSSITDNYYWNIIWLIPAFAIYSDALVTMNTQWLNSSPQILSRLMTALSLVVSWKWITLDIKSLEKLFYQKNLNHVLHQQTEGLLAQAQVLKETEEHIRICKHDMRHHLNLINTLLVDENYKEAQNYIQNIDSNLKNTEAIIYCENTIINSIILVYMAKAKEKDIFVASSLNIPVELPWHVNDIAMLIANAFENAIHATEKESKLPKSIEINANYHDHQLAIVIKNLHSSDVKLGPHGFPITEEANHGFGISSILAIVNKYHAYASCSHEHGWFILTFLFSDTGSEH